MSIIYEITPHPLSLTTGEEIRGKSAYTVRLDIPSGDRLSDYKRLRAEHPHGSARQALRAAKILERWRAQENTDEPSESLVRLLYIADESGADTLDWLDQSADDMAEGNERAWAAIQKQERERASSEGVYGLVGEYRTSATERWEQSYSCWGFIGNDGLQIDGYAADAMSETLDELAKVQGDCCPTCGRPKQ